MAPRVSCDHHIVLASPPQNNARTYPSVTSGGEKIAPLNWKAKCKAEVTVRAGLLLVVDATVGYGCALPWCSFLPHLPYGG